MVLLLEPSNNFKEMGETGSVAIPDLETKVLSIKQWVEPESTRARTSEFRISGRIKVTNNEPGLERVDALRRNEDCSAQVDSTQPSVRVESRGLLSLFSTPKEISPSGKPRKTEPWQHGP